MKVVVCLIISCLPFRVLPIMILIVKGINIPSYEVYIMEKAFLFDMDGVIINSEPMHEQVEAGPALSR